LFKRSKYKDWEKYDEGTEITITALGEQKFVQEQLTMPETSPLKQLRKLQ